MDILLTRPDAALVRQLEEAGHTALRWDLEESDPTAPAG